MTSSGFAEHGEHAVAVAFTDSESIPSTFAKIVFTSQVETTWTALYVLNVLEQPGADATHFIVTVVVALSVEFGGFRSEGLYCLAVDVASTGSGSCCAPASAPASTPD